MELLKGDAEVLHMLREIGVVLRVLRNVVVLKASLRVEHVDLEVDHLPRLVAEGVVEADLVVAGGLDLDPKESRVSIDLRGLGRWTSEGMEVGPPGCIEVGPQKVRGSVSEVRRSDHQSYAGRTSKVA